MSFSHKERALALIATFSRLTVAFRPHQPTGFSRWSLSYQGKVMLFYILKLLNKININKDEREYAVNIEEIEDFSIIRDSE